MPDKAFSKAEKGKTTMLRCRVSVLPPTTSMMYWHRVLVGPYSDWSELADARSRLSNNGIDSLLLKRKQ
ncbi:MAG TPA: hypothetical protein ENI05_08140 [Porticoccus sp.]|nr:hypothetical protein [Porticoccus sp.]